MRHLLRYAALASLALRAAALHADPARGDEGEAWWRAQHAARAAAVASLEREVAACEEREAPPAYDGVAGYVTRGRDGRWREVEIKRCDQQRADLEAARTELDQFEEQARRRGIPPGWLR
ncbi:MAG: hypothetical protein DCC71_01075 [Proteobacteria bacterium]|nr:MAG: hypothetical protein DCC71_01075 [Pseudomonadota bacterium]